ncbi:MAG: HK97-gp10 family putative phage morphogenesis protein [Alphaproteobacteria bacterium]
MAKPFRVSVDGLREMDENLGQLSKATARGVLRRVLVKAGQPIADAAAQMAPDDPNTGAPDLKSSMLVTSRLKNEVGKAEFAEVMRSGGSRSEAVQAMRDARRDAGGSFAEMYVGPDAKIFYAHMQEFGTAHHGPQPFMRPAFDQKKGEALDIIKNELGGEIDKAVLRMKKRLAKKAGG